MARKILVLSVGFVLIGLLVTEGYTQEPKPILIGTSISQTGGFARTARGQLRSSMPSARAYLLTRSFRRLALEAGLEV